MVMRIHRYGVPAPVVRSVFDLDRNVDDLFGDFLSLQPALRFRGLPRIDVAEHADRMEVVAELPGVRKEDVHLSVDDGWLALKWTRPETSMPEGSAWIRNEIRAGEFSRTIDLPYPVKTGAISAELTDGILRVVLPKADEARPREITIR
jgi:HSP20 family protein